MNNSWRDVNRANWDERVGIHLVSGSYDLTPLREGRARLHPIEEAELGSVDGLRILHLQCHFGRDTLTLLQKGAREVVGLDFSAPAIAAARELAAQLGLAERARFVESDVYDARTAIAEHASFDRVFVTWGTVFWLPDIAEWARIAAYFLKPGGMLYLADGHPCAFVFDDDNEQTRDRLGRPTYARPYFSRAAIVGDDSSDYADETAVLANAQTYEWAHQLGDIVNAVIEAGLTLSWLHEHETAPWRVFESLLPIGNDMYGWPDKPWLPLTFSLQATRPIG